MTARELDLTEFFIPSRSGKMKKWTFSLEYGRGETYASGRPTLYAHSTYERGSVLAGRPQRVFAHQWETAEEARAALAKARKDFPKFRYSDELDSGGSSHVPIAQIVSHLPDDTDY